MQEGQRERDRNEFSIISIRICIHENILFLIYYHPTENLIYEMFQTICNREDWRVRVRLLSLSLLRFHSFSSLILCKRKRFSYLSLSSIIIINEVDANPTYIAYMHYIHNPSAKVISENLIGNLYVVFSPCLSNIRCVCCFCSIFILYACWSILLYVWHKTFGKNELNSIRHGVQFTKLYFWDQRAP